jgi:selenocysteine-specific elongation factor
MRHFILGTAGHVDHGKTELIKGLTGRDTDRLKEEKVRGISIELGFAPLLLDENTFIGIIDAPGHERFIKHMVAGAGGIDIAMLLVAADEGVMPQTKEHLEVLKFLAINHGIIVISKIDLASEDMIAVLKSEIEDLVEGTFLQDADVIATSARTGAGLELLKSKLLEICLKIKERDAGGPFRLPIDRVFISSGIGVIVTGSCYSGTLNVGDALDLLPSGKRVRVRELQIFNERQSKGYAGERLAVALQGVKLSEVQRGDVLVAPSKFQISHRFDARVRMAEYGSFELKNRQRVRVHHGAKEVMGRIILLDVDKLRSGDSALAQLALESPLVVAEGDYFVLRQYSPQRVLGGGRVITPTAPKHKRFEQKELSNLEILEKGDLKEKTIKAILDAGATGYEAANLGQSDYEMMETGDVVAVEGLLFHKDVLKDLAERVYEIAKSYCGAHPLLYGIDKEELKQRLNLRSAKGVFNGVLRELPRYRGIFIKGNRVRAGDQDIDIPASLKHEVDSLEGIIKKAGLIFLSMKEIKGRWKGKSSLQEALQFLRETGRIAKIADSGYIHNDALEECHVRLSQLFRQKPKITVGEFKEAFELTRKHAIPLLEYLDENKITVRRGDLRERGPALLT